MTAAHGPVIERDEHGAPFFDAARRDELLIRRCVHCERWLPPQAAACTGCGSTELVWAPAAGTARLVTWAVVHSAPHRAFADQVPYITGYVELTEGPWLTTRIVSADRAKLQADAALHVAFVHPDEGESYPVFVPTDADGT
jgi:uncharacterized OB-fold protein